MVSNPFLLYTQKPHTLRIKAAFFEEGGLGEGTFFLQKEGSFPQKTPFSLRVYLKNSLRLHHGGFSAISVSENLDLAPLNLRFPSLN